MKNLLTLFLVAITTLSFGQQGLFGSRQQFKVLPGSILPSDYKHHSNQASSHRSSNSCDTSDILDYNTVNEFYSNVLNISYEGSWNVPQAQLQPWAQEITSSFVNLTSYRNNLYSYVLTAYDTLAFADLSTQAEYTKTRKTSTITIDSILVIMGIAGDTTTGGLMSNDSLVFQIFPIPANGVVSTVAAQRISFIGTAQLAPFITGTTPGFLKGNIVQTGGLTLAQGQGFAIKMDYYNSDTSSHCFVAYSFADSCGQVTIGASHGIAPAYPSPFNFTAGFNGNGGNTFFGVIDSLNPTTADIFDVSNAFAYPPTALPLPSNCLYVYNQNWEMLSFVTIQNSLGLTIADSVYTIPCNGSVNPIALTTVRTGDLAGAVYTWSSNVYGSTNTPNSSFFNPGTYGVTVTNSSGCSATAQEVATYANNLTANPPSFSFPSEICQNEPVTFTNTSTYASGYHWTFGGDNISGTTSTNPTVTYTTSGNFVVGLTEDTGGCVLGSNQTISVLNCTGIQNVAFDNTVSIIPNPSNGNVTISVNNAGKDVTITIYNILGESVKSYATEQSASVFNKNLDLGNLANGTYLVKIQTGSKVATKKLVITK